jgi:lipid-A-disaccharide synthase-like uncharacterized protein
MLIEHLIHTAKTNPWKLAGFIAFLLFIVVLVVQIVKREVLELG